MSAWSSVSRRCMGIPAKSNRPRRWSLSTPQKRGSSVGPATHFYEEDSTTRRAAAKAARRAERKESK